MNNLKTAESKFIELSETDIFRKASASSKKYQQSWLDSRDAWPKIFEQLAADFLAGNAQVNPIDEKTCQYCELHSLCRISQLRDAKDPITQLDVQEAL